MSNYQMSIRSVWRKLVTWGFTKKTLKWTAVFVALKWILTLTLVTYLISIDKWRISYWLVFPAVAIGLLYYQKRKKQKG
ncbi:MAG: hypothetical protein ACI9JN_000888 [Bacteroidia bacterium]|jgi:hypothetical protein